MIFHILEMRDLVRMGRDVRGVFIALQSEARDETHSITPRNITRRAKLFNFHSSTKHGNFSDFFSLVVISIKKRGEARLTFQSRPGGEKQIVSVLVI